MHNHTAEAGLLRHSSPHAVAMDFVRCTLRSSTLCCPIAQGCTLLATGGADGSRRGGGAARFAAPAARRTALLAAAASLPSAAAASPPRAAATPPASYDAAPRPSLPVAKAGRPASGGLPTTRVIPAVGYALLGLDQPLEQGQRGDLAGRCLLSEAPRRARAQSVPKPDVLVLRARPRLLYSPGHVPTSPSTGPRPRTKLSLGSVDEAAVAGGGFG